jgi:hypothetical protein
MGQLDMDEGLINAIAAGLCSFTVGTDRNQDGYGRIALREHTAPCEQQCDYCQLKAKYLAECISNYLGETNDQ